MPIKKGYELTNKEISEAYSQIKQKISMPAYFYPACIKMVHSFMEGNYDEKLLDIGCGNGYLLNIAATSFPNLNVYGIELSEELVKSSMLRLKDRGKVIQGNALFIPVKNGTFDIVTVTEVIEHLKEPNVLLQEVRRVLKSNGRALITIPNMSAYMPFMFFAERIPIKFIRDIFLPWEHPLKTFQPIDTAYTYEEIIYLLEKNNFKITKIEGGIYLPYLTYEIPLWRKIYRKFLQSTVDTIFNKLGLQQKAYHLFVVAEKVQKCP